jgi:hypothetical protein
MSAMRRAARAEYLARFTPETNYQRMIEIFEIAMAHANGRLAFRPASAPVGGALASTATHDHERGGVSCLSTTTCNG